MSNNNNNNSNNTEAKMEVKDNEHNNTLALSVKYGRSSDNVLHHLYLSLRSFYIYLYINII